MGGPCIPPAFSVHCIKAKSYPVKKVSPSIYSSTVDPYLLSGCNYNFIPSKKLRATLSETFRAAVSEKLGATASEKT